VNPGLSVGRNAASDTTPPGGVYGNSGLGVRKPRNVHAELDTIQQRALTPIEQHGLQRLRALAERCRGSDLQLWFLGD
jgi:hypothetical protein